MAEAETKQASDKDLLSHMVDVRGHKQYIELKDEMSRLQSTN